MLNLDTYEAKMAFLHQLNAECNVFQGEEIDEETCSTEEMQVANNGKYLEIYSV